MPLTSSFRDLDVWQESMTLVEEIYALSKRFPSEERFGLTSQLRRAAVSIPSNIGEGARRWWLGYVASRNHQPPTTYHHPFYVSPQSHNGAESWVFTRSICFPCVL